MSSREASLRPPLRLGARGFRLIVAPAFEAGVRGAGLDRAAGFDRAMAQAPEASGGRSVHRMLHSELWPAAVRMRPLRHGGLLGGWLGDRFLGHRRPERELRVWRALEARGAPLPQAVLAASRRRGLFWHPALGALDRERAQDALRWLESSPRDASACAQLAIAMARSIRRFHDAGGLHGDLHLANILVEKIDEDLHCWLVDLDRAHLRTTISPARRMRELMRLLRSTEKTGPHPGLTSRTRVAFFAAYCRGDRGLRRAMLAAAPRETRRIRLHRLGWRLGRRLGTTLLAAGMTMLGLACSDVRTGHDSDPPSSVRFSLLATGDTGRTRALAPLFEGQLSVARALVSEDQQRPVDGLVLLGDNFYWHGLDREHLVPRLKRNLVVPYCHFLDLSGPRSSEIEGACAVARDQRHPVPIYAVLGNHDLELPESAHLQREVVPEFLPGWTMGRSLATVVELEEGISLILFESEIAIEDPDAIRKALLEAITLARGPWRILATHRPIATDDRGGEPVGGYPAWVRSAIADSGRPVQLVLAGHHHSLQAFALLEPSPLLQIGAGSGSRAEPPLARDLPAARFGALELGFARVDLIGRDQEERLAVSLFGAARWPVFSRVRPHRELARFEVDRAGQVRDVMGAGPTATAPATD